MLIGNDLRLVALSHKNEDRNYKHNNNDKKKTTQKICCKDWIQSLVKS
jgi:hypothetical protein